MKFAQRELWKSVTMRIILHSLIVKWLSKRLGVLSCIAGTFGRLRFSLGKISNQALTYQIKLN